MGEGKLYVSYDHKEIYVDATRGVFSNAIVLKNSWMSKEKSSKNLKEFKDGGLNE